MDFPIFFSLPSRLTPLSAWHEHIPFAMFLVDVLKPEAFVELGTQWGDSYCAFCQAVQDLKLNARCYALDTWKATSTLDFTARRSSRIFAPITTRSTAVFPASSKVRLMR